MGFQENTADNLSLSPQQQPLHTPAATQAACPAGTAQEHPLVCAPASAHRAGTFRHFENLLVLLAPADGVQVSCQDVTPEVGFAVLAVAVVAQQQQLPTRGDDGGNPVGVLVRLDSHFQLHAGGKTILQACVHLKRRIITSEHLSETLLNNRGSNLESSLARKLKPNAIQSL